jgi:hypothetical protein
LRGRFWTGYWPPASSSRRGDGCNRPCKLSGLGAPLACRLLQTHCLRFVCDDKYTLCNSAGVYYNSSCISAGLGKLRPLATTHAHPLHLAYQQPGG